MRKIFTLFVAALCCATMFAQREVQIGYLYYNLYATNQTAEVTTSYISGNITIPASVDYYSLPYSVTRIGKSAFKRCTGLTSVTIPNSVTSIGYLAFSDCSGLTSVTIPNSVTSIEGSTFSGCSGLTSVTIPNSVTSIGTCTFEGCTGLTSVTIPNSVTSIGTYTFKGCTGLTSVTIPNSVTSIGSGAFANCSGLTNVTIPNSVKSIELRAFSGCSGLTSVHINDISAWCGITFESYESNPLAQAHHLYLNDTEIKNLVIPNSVTTINDYAFSGCSGLTSVTIPNSVTSIGYLAFDGCAGLISVIWNVKECDEGYYNSLFSKCPVESFVFGNGVEVIPNGICRNLNKLTEITISSSVKTIKGSGGWEPGAFEGCTNLTKIVNYGQTPANVYSAAFDGVDKFRCVLYVPKNSIDMYKNAAVWRDFYYVEPLENLEAIDQVNVNQQINNKFIQDGHVLIQQGDKTYTITGQEVK